VIEIRTEEFAIADGDDCINVSYPSGSAIFSWKSGALLAGAGRHD
jgi:hypothetical protein